LDDVYITKMIDLVRKGFTMLISKKCQYALRAVLELALAHKGRRSVKVQQIAAAQGIPPRFLEVILNQLRHGGTVQSQRGRRGGYALAADPATLTVGRIIRQIQGPALAVSEGPQKEPAGRHRGDKAFEQLWREASSALQRVYDNTTFAQLVEREKAGAELSVASYSI